MQNYLRECLLKALNLVEQRRSYTPEEKLKIVLEGLSDTIQIYELCRKYGKKPARFYYWKDHYRHE